MSSKRLFSWSKRTSNVEPYYKTGGLLPIEGIGTELGNIVEAKDAQKVRRRPSNLIIIPPDNQPLTSSPLSSPYNAPLLSSTSNLMAIFNDMLRSPALSAGTCPRSASVHKPLPTRPRSSSVPASPDLPVELPGSLLQRNQGFPYIEAQDFVPSRPTSQNVRRGTHPPDRNSEDEGDILDLLHLFPEPLSHSKSVPSLNTGYRESTMKSARVGNASSTSANKSKPHRVHHRKALSDIEWQTPSESQSTGDDSTTVSAGTLPSNNATDGSLLASDILSQPSLVKLEAGSTNRPAERRASRRDDLVTSLTPIPATARNTTTEGPQNITATQDQTIATLRAQFRGLRASHEAHVSSLAEAHAAEVASLRNYTRLLEEQLAQRLSLHHDVTTSADARLASGIDPLIFLDTNESPLTLSRESSQHTAATSASSSLSYWSVPEKQLQLYGRSQESPEMESLKRKLSTTRRPSTADRNLLPELNQYKQNNAALQTQISSLMAKLNESKKSEKALRATLQDVEQRCAEAERQSSEAQQLAMSPQALQNTIDHLESRLEIANTEKLDAQEELFNMRALKSPFDAQFPEMQMAAQTAHESMDTVFSTSSDHPHDSNTTLSKSVAHLERLQDEIRQKDAYIAELESDGSSLQQMVDQMHRQCDEMNLQLDIQNELLGRTKETDAHIEQLRAAVSDREAVIAEKEKSVRIVERQLEHHKLLLQAEIRKHATASRYFNNENNPLPELTALATKNDIDRWIQKLNQRLRKAKPMIAIKNPENALDVHIEDMRNEIDFYVREIIYYKLDIRGYKSDIKKLNKITAQLGSYGNRTSDLDSDTSSLRPAPTPSRTRFLSTTPELKGSGYPSPAFAGPISANIGSPRALTPPVSTAADSQDISPSQQAVQVSNSYKETASRQQLAPQTPTKATVTGASDDHSEMLGIAMGGVTTPSAFGNPGFPTPPDNRHLTIERDISDAPTVRPVVPTSKFQRDFLSSSPSPQPQHNSHTRTGSDSSTLGYPLQPYSTATRPERKLSSSSSTGIPFVLAMNSPNNPAIAVAAKNMPAVRPHRATSTTSKAGIDGTMASSTPPSSPMSIGSPSPVPITSPLAATGQKRKLSLSFRRQENEASVTSSHSRSPSGGSIRTAIRWTKGPSVEKNKEKEVQIRKDSIGMPQTLGIPPRLEIETNFPGSDSRTFASAIARGEREV
ncbi:hypothetical protein SVAN01_11744 [Stagonosporopsis vannaccii]|nr:hypothetical protein SVAN01_11744 [Stagonosporopsis vannaccii]